MGKTLGSIEIAITCCHLLRVIPYSLDGVKFQQIGRQWVNFQLAAVLAKPVSVTCSLLFRRPRSRNLSGTRPKTARRTRATITMLQTVKSFCYAEDAGPSGGRRCWRATWRNMRIKRRSVKLVDWPGADYLSKTNKVRFSAGPRHCEGQFMSAVES